MACMPVATTMRKVMQAITILEDNKRDDERRETIDVLHGEHCGHVRTTIFNTSDMVVGEVDQISNDRNFDGI